MDSIYNRAYLIHKLAKDLLINYNDWESLQNIPDINQYITKIISKMYDDIGVPKRLLINQRLLPDLQRHAEKCIELGVVIPYLMVFQPLIHDYWSGKYRAYITSDEPEYKKYTQHISQDLLSTKFAGPAISVEEMTEDSALTDTVYSFNTSNQHLAFGMIHGYIENCDVNVIAIIPSTDQAQTYLIMVLGNGILQGIPKKIEWYK